MKILLGIGAFFLWISVQSQMQHPKVSPLAKVEQTVGFTTFTAAYSRPATKGRAIFGTYPNGKPGLVPYGRIWRVGANASTKFTSDTGFKVMEHPLPAGTYALYAFPNADMWEVVFHNNIDHWGDGRNAYDPKEDALRIAVKPVATLAYQENFQIEFDHIDHNAANMVWHWANTKVVIPLTVDTRSAMEKQIQEVLQQGASAQSYYEIARYYQEQGILLEEALEYVNKAIAKGGDTYYFYRIKSLILADLGEYTAAINAARQSLSLAQEQGKDEFVRANQKHIDLWLSKL